MQLWMDISHLNFTLTGLSELDEIQFYNLGHARNAEAYYCLPLSSWLMPYLRFTAQTRLSAWTCFSYVQVELWDRQVQIKVIIKS